MDLELSIIEPITPDGATGKYYVSVGERWLTPNVIVREATFDEAVQAAIEFLKNIKAA